jgi:hypothetical protein
MGGGVRGCPLSDQAEAAIDRDVVLVAERRDSEVDRRQAAVLARLAFVYLTVQRASRSFWASLAGLSFHSSGTWPSLMPSSPQSCYAAATIVASTI